MDDLRVSRRIFLLGAAATVASCATTRSGPRTKRVSPNDKLNVAVVGIGGQGGAEISEVSTWGTVNVVALCDVDWDYAAETFRKFPNAARYKDFRRMLEKQKDIDAVYVATPDHTHAVVAMTAMRMGKHVHVEKPMTHSVYEARVLAETAKETGVVTQVGNEGQASERPRRLCEYIWDGAIGDVREVHAWTDRPVDWWPQGIPRPRKADRIPRTLDWDLWLGPAPERPFNRAYHPFAWRGWWDFGTGALGDMGSHWMDPVFRALKLSHPVSVQACSTPVNDETYPLASIVTYRFPARGNLPPVKVMWYDGGLKPPVPEECDRPLAENGTLYIGDKGKILDGRLIPESRMRDYPPPNRTLPRSPGHWEEFIEACKGSGIETGSNFQFSSLVTEVLLLGNIALRFDDPLEWDGERMKFTHVPEANQFLHREYRKGWHL